MKKTLIALAALAAAGATLAQSSVTIYGRMDLGMSQQTITTPDNPAGVDSLSLAGAQNERTGSRLGFRGTEDLGGGLCAGFQYEIGINADRDAPGNANTRLANLSLSGGFGTVVVGTFMNAFDKARDFSPATGDVPGGDFAEFALSQDAVPGSISQFDGRSQNAIAYVSPAFNGFTASLALVREDNTPLHRNQDSSGIIIGLGYSQGPLRAQFAFGDMNVDDNNTGANVVDLRNWALGASYNFGPAVLSFVYEDTRNPRNTSSTAIADSHSWEIGASFPMGAFAPYVTFGQGELVTGAGAVSDTNSWQIGTTYNLSARTWVYAAIGEAQRETSAGLNEREETGYSIGIVHTF